MEIKPGINIPDSEIQLEAIRAQGAGGQNVNKVSTAVHLRFDVPASSLPEDLKQQVLERSDKRISKDGVIIIKAQRFRSREKNITDAIQRLQALLGKALEIQPKRMRTRPSKASKERRLKEKQRRGATKQLRGSVKPE